MKKITSILLTLLLLMSLFAGCATEKPAETTAAATEAAPVTEAAETTAPAEETRAEAESKDFVYGCVSISLLDPAIDYQGWYTERYGIGETLFVIDENLKVQNLLAQDYSVSDDHMTWTITLKDGIQFQNGKPLDGAAVKANLERAAELNPRAADQLNIASVAAEGNQVMITTNAPNATMINSLADPYACIIDLDSGTDFDTAPVGTGPYIVRELVPDVSVYLEPNENYWGGMPQLDSLTVKSIPDLDTLAMAMQNGELDAAAGMSYDMVDTFKDDPAFKVSQAASARVYMLYFNDQREFMNDPAFRRAICMLVDKESYSNVLINGAGTPTKSAFPSNVPYGDSSKLTDVPDYDPEGAKALLAENGYTDTDGDGFLDKDGKKVSLKIISYGRTGLPQSCQALQSALQDVGIEASFEQMDSTEQIMEAGDYDISAYAVVTTPTGDPFSYLNSIAGPNGNMNFSKYSNPEVDKLLQELSQEFDTARRDELAIQIQQILTKDSHFCFMFHLNMYVAMKANVEGLTQSPVDYYSFNVNTTK